MCDVTLALTAGATILGAIGTVQAAQATAQASEYNAKVGEINAVLADRRANDAIERGQKDEQRKRAQVAQLQGQQIAAMSANGVDITYGSPLDTLIDTAALGELDALTIRANSYRESYDHQVDAVNQRAGVTMQRAAGQNALTAGYLDATATVLTGGASGYKDYSRSKIGEFA